MQHWKGGGGCRSLSLRREEYSVAEQACLFQAQSKATLLLSHSGLLLYFLFHPGLVTLFLSLGTEVPREQLGSSESPASPPEESTFFLSGKSSLCILREPRLESFRINFQGWESFSQH